MLGLPTLFARSLNMAFPDVIAVRDCRVNIGAPRKSILYAIASRIGRTGYAWPSEETIAKDSGMSLRSVKRHIRHLRRESFLLRTRETRIRSWCYRLGPAITCSARAPNGAPETGQLDHARVTMQSAKGANLTPKVEKQGTHYKAKGNHTGNYPEIEYSEGPLPAIEDYSDIDRHDPILVAMAITGERAKTGWGHWVKRLKQAKTLHGKETGEKLFCDCLHRLFGLSKEPQRAPLGAILNKLLEEQLGVMNRE